MLIKTPNDLKIGYSYKKIYKKPENNTNYVINVLDKLEKLNKDYENRIKNNNLDISIYKETNEKVFPDDSEIKLLQNELKFLNNKLKNGEIEVPKENHKNPYNEAENNKENTENNNNDSKDNSDDKELKNNNENENNKNENNKNENNTNDRKPKGPRM
jgi:translation initiation factor IF-2